MSQRPRAKVLVVCLGNICRSPMGEAVLKNEVDRRDLNILVDSCGTAGYHAGEAPDPRTVKTCRQHGMHINHSARQIKSDDFYHFDYILAADESNFCTLERMKPIDATAEIRLWGSYLDGQPIADPYYGGVLEFEAVYNQCVNLSNAFLDTVFPS